MRGFKLDEVLMSEDLVEDAVGVPRGAAADEFAICCSKRVEYSIVEFLVVCHEVKFICIHHMQCWSSDGFGVVRECFDAASVTKVIIVFCGLRTKPAGSLLRKCRYTRNDSFGLAPRGTHYSNCSVWMSNSIL